MTKTITALYDTYAQAEDAVRRLETAGVPHSDISIAANRAGAGDRMAGDRFGDGTASADAGAGAGIGAVIGGGGGLLAGLGIIAIPGVGPVVAAGWLAATAIGAIAGAVVGGAAGGLVGALTKEGVPEDHAHVFAEGVRRGGALVTARVEDAEATRYSEMLNQLNAVDVSARGDQYRQGGWKGFDQSAPVYSADQISAERRSYGVAAEDRSFARDASGAGPDGEPLTPQEQEHDRIAPSAPSPTPLV